MGPPPPGERSGRHEEENRPLHRQSARTPKLGRSAGH